jgi:hypothetical protein
VRRDPGARLTGYELFHLVTVLEAQRLPEHRSGHVDELRLATVLDATTTDPRQLRADFPPSLSCRLKSA